MKLKSSRTPTFSFFPELTGIFSEFGGEGVACFFLERYKENQKIMKNLEAALKDEKSNNLWKRDKGGKWIKLAKKKSAA
jgi:hypothetical protein